MVRPELTVIVTMGDGGLGIGGAHLISTCRKNIDLTLLVLNNFNYGMTGGQSSSTTPVDAQVGSGFLNQIEKPIDVCRLAAAAGAAYTSRSSAYRKDLAAAIEKAVRFEGFSIVDIWGVCPGRYTKRNRLTPASIEASLAALPPADGPVSVNNRPEYSRLYREKAALQAIQAPPVSIEATCRPPQTGRQEVMILGSAGQRIVTAGELLCVAGLTAGLQATLKNDYPITVLRGHSVSEVVLSDKEIGYTGIESPETVVALAQEGVDRKKSMFAKLSPSARVLKAKEVDLPATSAEVEKIDFKARGVRPPDRALASLAVLASENRVLSAEMLEAALKIRFKAAVLEKATALVEEQLRG
jgi:Pyruvate/2-oxoacid:ferredoxin oxidoreductase gamma subunit